MPGNIDPRGVARGGCTKCGLCDLYEYEPNSPRANCCYCDCPAIYHKNLDPFQQSRPLPASGISTSSSNNSLTATLTVNPLAPSSAPSTSATGSTIIASAASNSTLNPLSASRASVPSASATSSTIITSSASSSTLNPLADCSVQVVGLQFADGNLLPACQRDLDILDSSVEVSSADVSIELADTDQDHQQNLIRLNPDVSVLSNILNTGKIVISPSDIPMPAVLSDDLNAALDSGCLTKNQRSSLCRAVVGNLRFLGMASNSHLKAAADRMVIEYTPMKRASDPNQESLYKKLLKCRNRKDKGQVKRLQPQNRPIRAPTSLLSGKQAQEQMVADWASGRRSVTTMSPLLVACRELRRKEASKLKAVDLITDFPALTIPSLLIQEFEIMPEINTTSGVMKENWLKTLPSIVTYFSSNNICSFEEALTADQQTILILENMHMVKTWAQSRLLSNKRCRILEVFPVNTPEAEARPRANDPVRMSAIRDSEGGLDFVVYTDREPVFITKDPVQAIILLLATYWVFDLKLMPANKQPILFLAACMLGSTVNIRKYINSYGKFSQLCEYCNIVV